MAKRNDQPDSSEGKVVVKKNTKKDAKSLIGGSADVLKKKSLNSRRKTKTVKKTFVLDTSVVIHDPYSIFKFEEHDVYLPMMLFTEIDDLKSKNDSVAPVAREFIRLVDGILNGKSPNGGISLGAGLGKLHIDIHFIDFHDDLKEKFTTKLGDNHFLNSAYCLQKEYPNKDVVLVSKDVNLRLRALGMKIKSEDFMTDRVDNVDFLSEEIQTIEAPDQVLDCLYKNLQAEFLIKGAEANQNFILKCGSKTAPVRYLNGCVYFIKKDGMFAFSIKPKNAEQAFAMEALLNPEIQLVTIQGSAGTGKTLLSLASAFEQIKTKKNIEKNPDRPTGFYKKIYYSRKIVSVGDKDLGFLPGDAKNKVDPYMGGMNDNIECLKDVSARNSEAIDKAILNEVFKVEILNYIRGRSINNVIFIIDEAQNLTSHDIKTIISRAGEGTKIILIGDIHQIDLKNLDKWSNGLSHTIVKIRNHKRCAHIRLVKGERSELADMANLL